MIIQRPIADYLSQWLKMLVISMCVFFLLFGTLSNLPLIIALSVLSATIVLSYKRYIWNTYDYWHFDGQTLVRGRQPNLKISLTQIESLRYGLPKLSGWYEKAISLDSKNYHNLRLACAQKAILLYLNNNRILPLSVEQLKGGNMFSLYFTLSFIRHKYPDNSTMAQLCQLAKTAKNNAEFEQLAEAKKLDIHCFIQIQSDLEHRQIIKKANGNFSTDEIKKLTFSKLNKIVQF